MLVVANTNIRGTVATCLPMRLLHHYLGLYLEIRLPHA